MNILSEKIIFSKNKNCSKNFLLQAFISASLLFSSKLQNTTDNVFEIFFCFMEGSDEDLWYNIQPSLFVHVADFQRLFNAFFQKPVLVVDSVCILKSHRLPLYDLLRQ